MDVKEIFIDEFVDTIGGKVNEKNSVKSDDILSVELPPGCWGPMITPSIKSGHEVSVPLYVEGAEKGDSLLIEVLDIQVISEYSISGISEGVEGRYDLDPTTKAICPECNTKNPLTEVKGIGKDGIVCKKCGAKIIPQFIKNGYTMKFDDSKKYGLTLEDSEEVAKNALQGNDYLPKNSHQNSSLILNVSDVSGVISRVNPFIGNIGCVPEVEIPSSRNCGDSLKSLLKDKKLSDLEKDNLTDAHMDVNTVTVGSKVLCPVKVEGAGLYLGDVHAMQGDGELAGHTTDITARVTLKVKVIKGLKTEGPIIIPTDENLIHNFRNFSSEEIDYINKKFNSSISNDEFIMAQFIGSGSNIEEGIDNAVNRISSFTGFSKDEVINRCTMSGGVGIGRVSGLVYLTMLTPRKFFNH